MKARYLLLAYDYKSNNGTNGVFEKRANMIKAMEEIVAQVTSTHDRTRITFTIEYDKNGHPSDVE